MMNSQLGIIFMMLLIPLNTFAEKYEVKGKVTDNNKEPLVGATVVISGTTEGSVVGFDGSYIIKGLEPGEYTFTVSYIGCKQEQHTIKLTNNEEISFTLDEDDLLMGEIVVTAGGIKNTISSARATERMAPMVVNVVSGAAIELSPDLNVADVMQRISGVSLEQSNAGVGSYAIVRGMPKRYSYTLVNGVKIPSPDNKNRYVPLDMFPSELMDRIEVTKALTPDMEGDAVGGAMNLVMKNAPDNFMFKVNASVGMSTLFSKDGIPFRSYSQNNTDYNSPHSKHPAGYSASINDFTNNNHGQTQSYNPVDYNLGLSVGDRFFNNKLGLVIAGNVQSLHRGSETDFFTLGAYNIEDNTVAVQTMQEREYSSYLFRGGFHNKLDYQFNHNHSISLYNAYIYEREDQVRENNRILFTNYDFESKTGEVVHRTRNRTTEQSIYNSTLQGNHQLTARWKMDWSGVYSMAQRIRPDQLDFRRRITHLGGNILAYDIDRYEYLPTRQWEDNSDRDLSFYINTQIDLSSQFNIKIGGMYRDKERENNFVQYNFKPDTEFYESAITRKDRDWRYDEITWELGNPRGSSSNPLNYDASEKISSAYTQFKWDIDKKIELVGGVRAEHTIQGYELRNLGDFSTLDPIGEQEYTDFLPSFHAKYIVNNKTNIRTSYFRSVIRPGFFEIVPYNIGSAYSDSEFDERGNPDLKRTLANNIDLRFEFFPSPQDNLFIGAFYKDINDPIEEGIVVDGNSTYLQPGNYGNATNYGLEFDMTKFFRQFGVKANYTFTESSITTDKVIYEREDVNDNSSDIVAREVEQTRPLQGQSRHIGNISLLYRNPDRGLEFQLANVFTGKRIAQITAYYEKDYWQESMWQLDFSAEKTFDFGLVVFLKARNLLDTERVWYINQGITETQVDYESQGNVGDNLVVRNDRYGRNFLIGLKYKF
ncbi:TonB-dependent receptor [Saccharicrinis aurantiacus]|uniref:TonB-dependent receptor n=1 Tax=Saccharicrinis aurantiacus TaxID=1849719 RepID=UPI0009F98503|nr:TonB-dependent receptor [Saccharicrinis aurantiacus]